jgi:hypothetical protein
MDLWNVCRKEKSLLCNLKVPQLMAAIVYASCALYNSVSSTQEAALKEPDSSAAEPLLCTWTNTEVIVGSPIAEAIYCHESM